MSAAGRGRERESERDSETVGGMRNAVQARKGNAKSRQPRQAREVERLNARFQLMSVLDRTLQAPKLSLTTKTAEHTAVLFGEGAP